MKRHHATTIVIGRVAGWGVEVVETPYGVSPPPPPPPPATARGETI